MSATLPYAHQKNFAHLALLSRVFLIVCTVIFLYGCRSDGFRGVFVARFIDDSGFFTKRITVPSLLEPELRLSLATRRYVCELRVAVPSELTPEILECDQISGVGKVLCSDAREIPVGWKMTSCHSGFGRSVEGVKPPFVFGFSGNAYTAQIQLDLAKQARFLPPEDVNQLQSKPPEPEREQAIWGANPWAIPYLSQ